VGKEIPYVFNENKPVESQEYPYYQGLGGWLVLPQIGLYLSILSNLVSLLRDPVNFFSGGWSVLMIAFIVVILVQLYKKKTILPTLIIILYSLGAIIQLVSIFLARMGGFEFNVAYELMRIAVPCLIWIPYFVRSKRVKATFVN